MRKLALISVSVFLIGVPAAALAATQRAGPPADTSLISSTAFVTDPFHAAEARSQAREAARRAKREAESTTREVTVSPQLQAIAACESGGDPKAVSSTGAYRGKYQFSPATWQAVGGSGDPAAAPEAEQDLRATILYEQSGPGQWPTCGQ